MVTSLDHFKENAQSLLEEALEYDEPIVLRTGLGNFFIIPEKDYMGMMTDGLEGMEEALANIK